MNKDILIISIILLTLGSIYTFVYTVIFPIHLPPQAYKRQEVISREAKKKTKKQISNALTQDRQEIEEEGVNVVCGTQVQEDDSERGKKNVVSLDLRDHPNIFLGAVPGGGKTTLLNNMILSMAQYTQNVSFYILSTPKGVIFEQYRRLMAHDVHVGLTEERWDGSLQFLVEEIDRREEKIATAAKKIKEIEDITSYNKVFTQEKMPFLVLIIDEVQVLLSGEHKKKNLERLLNYGRRGRSLGLPSIIATQYLSKEELSGKLIGSIPTRIALLTADADASRAILGKKGAELLDPKKGEGIIKSYEHPCIKFTNTAIDPLTVSKKIDKINKKYGYTTTKLN